MALTNDQWQEALVQLANSGIFPGTPVTASATASAAATAVATLPAAATKTTYITGFACTFWQSCLNRHWSRHRDGRDKRHALLSIRGKHHLWRGTDYLVSSTYSSKRRQHRNCGHNSSHHQRGRRCGSGLRVPTLINRSSFYAKCV
jgi:hypothetical protein